MPDVSRRISLVPATATLTFDANGTYYDQVYLNSTVPPLAYHGLYCVQKVLTTPYGFQQRYPGLFDIPFNGGKYYTITVISAFLALQAYSGFS